MYKAKLFCLASAIGLLGGCMQGTPGGPGVQSSSTPQTYSAHKPVVSNSKETFTLTMPTLSTSLKQGESKSIKISISRGTDFQDDVDLRFSSIPQGISLDPGAPVLRKSEQDISISVSAADNAALGDFEVKVTGHPTNGGPDAQNELKLTVSAN